MFYVYGWFLQDGHCFYVGKGSKRRFVELANRNVYWHEIVNYERAQGRFVTSRIIYPDLEEAIAFEKERELISILAPEANIHSGGNGGSKMAEETKHKIRLKALGRKLTPETKEKLRRLQEDKILTAEVKEKIRQAARLREARKHAGQTVVTSGTTVGTI